MKRRIRRSFLYLMLGIILAMLCGCSQQPLFSSEATSAAAETAYTTATQSASETEQSAAEQTPTEQSTAASEAVFDNSPEFVASYLKEHGVLPAYFVTKKEAESAGWIPSEGNLWEVLPERVIGGDRFGNREGLLPPGTYRECDVNYNGGRRGPERIVYGEDGSIYYTGDHYQTFQRLD